MISLELGWLVDYNKTMTGRKIIHIDMDAFYASVEQRDHPQWQGKPVIVGGDPEKRGVVATCSYEARKFGIHSAMPAKEARQRCPQGIFVLPRMAVYKQVSHQLRAIFQEYTDIVEPLSLDEAYLDVTDNKKHITSATVLAREVLQRIEQETKLTASAGVSTNKFLAKVASDYRKPRGLTVIPPEKAQAFIAGLPIRKFFGVGKVTEKKMLALGIKTGADLRKKNMEELIHYFGKAGRRYYTFARGIDERPVESDRIRKSMGREKTFEKDLLEPAVIHQELKRLCHHVAQVLEQAQRQGNTVTLKVKYYDFIQITRAATLAKPVYQAHAIWEAVEQLLPKTLVGQKRVRLLGVALSGLSQR